MMSAQTKDLWADPVYRAKMVAAAEKRCRTPEAQAEWHLRRLKGQTPAAAAKRSDALKRAWSDPVVHKRWADAVAASLHTETYRELHRQKIRKTWDAPCEYKCGRRSVLMHSWWEVALAEWFDRVGTRWEYEPTRFYVPKSTDYRGVAYVPDFYLPDEAYFVEVKGFERYDFSAKIKAVVQAHPEVRVVIFDGKTLRNLGVVGSRDEANLSLASMRRRTLGVKRQWPEARRAA
jgi:hypothetical protein